MKPEHLSSMFSTMWTAIAPAVGNHLWQSTLFAVAAGSLTLVVRKNHARIRYGIWLAASVKFLLPSSLLVGIGSLLAWPHASPPTTAGFFRTMNEVSQPFTQSPIVRTEMSPAAPASISHNLLGLLPAMLTVTWLCGFAAVVLLWCLRWRRVAAAMREAAPLREGREVEAQSRLERIRGTQKRIEMVSSPASLEPGIFGITRPVLIWPEGISEHLEDAHLEAILAHEVWHVCRRDNLAAAIHMLVEALFWFHPLVWWLGTRLVEERERACDEEVVAMGGGPQVYAEGILKVCKFCVGSPLACISGVTGSDLKRRMVYIMTERMARKLDFGRKLLFSTAGVLALALPLAFGLVHAPQIRAQEQAATTGGTMSDVEFKIGPSAGGTPHRVGMMYSPTGFKSTNTTLQALIQEAYGVQANQIVAAPAWIKTPEFDLEIEPKADKPEPDGLSIDQSLEQSRTRNQRGLQAVLADRFKLKLHPETRELSTYVLVVADDGPKLQPAKPASSYPDPVRGPQGGLLNKSFRMLNNGSQTGVEAPWHRGPGLGLATIAATGQQGSG